MRITEPATTEELVVQVKAEMARQGISLPNLAHQLGIPYTTLRGRLAHPESLRYRDLLGVCRALDVPLSTIAARAEGRTA